MQMKKKLNNEDLSELIEIKRENLNKKVNDGIDEEALKLSVELDQLIVKYIKQIEGIG